MINKFIQQYVDKIKIQKFFKETRNMMDVKNITKNDSLHKENVNSEFGRLFYPYTGKEFESVKHTENYIIHWGHYIRGSTCSIFKKTDLSSNTTTEDLKDIAPVIAYADQTNVYGGLVGVGDIQISDKVELGKAMDEIIEHCKLNKQMKKSQASKIRKNK